MAGPRYKDAGGHLPVLAALKLVMAPPSKHGFSELWKPVAAGRFIKVPASGVDHRRFWGAMHRLSIGQLALIAERIPVAMVGRIGARCLRVGAGYDELCHLH